MRAQMGTLAQSGLDHTDFDFTERINGLIGLSTLSDMILPGRSAGKGTKCYDGCGAVRLGSGEDER